MHVELTRGAIVESAHRVDVAVVGTDGPLLTWGDVERPVIARSSLKFIQTLPLLRTGAAERFDVSQQEIALAASSHSGEKPHIEAVRAWLARLGLDASALECGSTVPLGAAAAIEHHREHGEPAAIINCCSGKHAGFLTVARHLDIDHVGYIEPDHPVQQLVTEAVAELTGEQLDEQTPGRDGCGIPTYGIPLNGLATAMARLVNPGRLEPATAAAAERLIDAAIGREFWVSGTGRHEVTLAELSTEPILVKTGAEGVFMAALPERGIGIALKVVDGAVRASEAAISATLARLGAIPEDEGRPILNAAGLEVGRVTVDASSPGLDRL
ncbi:MAG: asparaginase [Acidimicrobiales bacterium]